MKAFVKGYPILFASWCLTLVAMLTITGYGGALAQEWRPTDTVEIIVPDNPGGTNDRLCRLAQSILQNDKLVETPVTVVNKPGGSGNVSLSYLATKEGNAHYIRASSITLQLVQITGLSPYRYSDFTPLAQTIDDYVAFAVGADSNIKTGKDLLERLKKDPASLSLGTTAIGGSNHIPLFLVAKSVGADAKKVRTPVFKSSGEALIALLGGHINLLISSMTTVPPYVQAGTVRVLAVSSGKRYGGVLAQVPTWKELGVDCEFSTWYGFIGPKGLTAAQVTFWDDRLAKMLASAKWKAAVEQNFWIGTSRNSKEFKAYLDQTDPPLRAVLTDLGLAK